MLGLCWYDFWYSKAAISGANVARQAWIRKTKPKHWLGFMLITKKTNLFLFMPEKMHRLSETEPFYVLPPTSKNNLQRSIHSTPEPRQKAAYAVNYSYSSVRNGWPANQDQQARGSNELTKEVQHQNSLVLPSSSLIATRSIQEGAIKGCWYMKADVESWFDFSR